jgi:hypothetical protein
LVDADGILVDVDVQSIINTVSTREAKTADLDVFFGATFDHAGANGKVKKHRKCKMCPYVCPNYSHAHALIVCHSYPIGKSVFL